MTQLKKNGDKIFRRNTFSIDSKSNPKLFQILMSSMITLRLVEGGQEEELCGGQAVETR